MELRSAATAKFDQAQARRGTMTGVWKQARAQEKAIMATLREGQKRAERRAAYFASKAHSSAYSDLLAVAEASVMAGHRPPRTALYNRCQGEDIQGRCAVLPDGAQ